MKKILGLTVAALLVMGLVGGGTWAYFSDPEDSTGNVLTAGTLNLIPLTEGACTATYAVTPGGDGANGFVTFSSLAPGDTGSITWILYNDSSVSGNLTVSSTVTFGDTDSNEPEDDVTDPHANDGGGNGDLDEFVGVKLERGLGTANASAQGAFSYLVGTADNFTEFGLLEAALTDAAGVTIQADGGNDTLVYKLSFAIQTDITDPEADNLFGSGDDATADDNIIQSDNATIDITFTLTQQ